MLLLFISFLQWLICGFLLKGDRNFSGKGSAAMYGMMAKIPEKAILDDFIVEFFSQLYK